MSRGECPKPLKERVGCPWIDRKGGCFSDADHVVPQRFKDLGLLVSKYIYTPENIEQKCRWEHEEKTNLESFELIPDEEFMLDAVQRAFDAGRLTLRQREYDRLFNRQRVDVA